MVGSCAVEDFTLTKSMEQETRWTQHYGKEASLSELSIVCFLEAHT